MDLDINQNTLHLWKRTFRENYRNCFLGNGKVAEHEAEVHRLKQELFLAKVMDVYNTEIIGWAIDKRMTKYLVIKVIGRAIRKLLINFHIRQSMACSTRSFRRGGRGKYNDNATAEPIYHKKRQTRHI